MKYNYWIETNKYVNITLKLLILKFNYQLYLDIYFFAKYLS
jgi:hypothetical protein